MPNSMKIAAQTGNNCVARAFSTMRAVLGYDTPLPEGYVPNGPVRNVDLCALAMRFFPENEVRVWCEEKYVEGVEGIMWMGCGPIGIFDDHIMAFTYYTNKAESMTHMVVGYPTLFGHMKVHFCLAVKL